MILLFDSVIGVMIVTDAVMIGGALVIRKDNSLSLDVVPRQPTGAVKARDMGRVGIGCYHRQERRAVVCVVFCKFGALLMEGTIQGPTSGTKGTRVNFFEGGCCREVCRFRSCLRLIPVQRWRQPN